MTDEKPDFEALRAERNKAMQGVIDSIAKEWGSDPAEVRTSFNPDACYCACPTGPCEHDWHGWRDVHDDEGRCVGGEQVCARCGMGAMSHGIRTSE